MAHSPDFHADLVVNSVQPCCLRAACSSSTTPPPSDRCRATVPEDAAKHQAAIDWRAPAAQGHAHRTVLLDAGWTGDTGSSPRGRTIRARCHGEQTRAQIASTRMQRLRGTGRRRGCSTVSRPETAMRGCDANKPSPQRKKGADGRPTPAIAAGRSQTEVDPADRRWCATMTSTSRSIDD